MCLKGEAKVGTPRGRWNNLYSSGSIGGLKSGPKGRGTNENIVEWKK